VIDGTGAPGRDNQLVIIEAGRIKSAGAFVEAHVPPDAEVLDLRGRTVIPGLVGMHEHLFYEIERGGTQSVFPAQGAFARLYLGSGVTTIRTAGTVDFDGDRRMKHLIDQGSHPGPKIHLSSAYLAGGRSEADPDGAARNIARWADRGATSIKAYTTLRAPELRAAIDAARERGLRVTGHLCAVGYREASALGIDNVEHGLVFDADLYSAKRPDECPDQGAMFGEISRIPIADIRFQQTMSALIRRGTWVTSTLAVLETLAGREDAFDPRTMAVLAPRLRDHYSAGRETWGDRSTARARMWAAILHKEMELERLFVAAGGRLIAGADPTGWGGVVAGFGDQRGVELLVEAGLSPEQAIKVATANGAAFLYESQNVGTVTAGMQADLVVIRGNPSTKMSDIRNVELVFKDGVAYDSARLIASTEGTVGQFELRRLLRWPFGAIVAGLAVLLCARVGWRWRLAGLKPCATAT